MDLSSYSSVLAPSGLVTSLATFWYYGRKVLKEFKKSKEESANRILEEAKQFDKEIKEKLEARIDDLKVELDHLKLDMGKDLSNLKENHALELKNLSERVELLRTDLQVQHSQILNLLVQLIDKS